MRDPSHLFTLSVSALRGEGRIIIHAFDANSTDRTGHSRIDVKVRQGGKVIFPRGATWCGVPAGTSLDGVEARDLVLALVAMKPGDTDADYFASYTLEQLAWAERYGELISCERESRYCDPDTGAIAKHSREMRRHGR